MAPPPEATALRVALLIGDLHRAGAETQLVGLATGLARRGHACEIWTLKSRNDFAQELSDSGVAVRAFALGGSLSPRAPFRLWRELRRARPDVLHSFLLAPNLWAALVGHEHVPAVVVSVRTSYARSVAPFWRGLARLSHRLADRVVVNSRAALAEEVAAGADERRLAYVPNGVGVPPAPPQPPDRSALGLRAGPLVVCVAQLTPEKDHPTLLAAWARVAAARPDACLALVGDGERRPSLEARASRLGLSASVRFLGFRDTVEPYLAAADVVTLASSIEGTPNALLEAMALGRAIAAARAGDVPELLAEGRAGCLVAPGDTEGLARELLGLISDPARRSALGAAARARAADFSWERNVDANLAIYREILERPKAP